MAAAGMLLLDFLKYCKNNVKRITEQEDRKIIEDVTQGKIFSNQATPKEIATIMRLYRDLKKEERA